MRPLKFARKGAKAALLWCRTPERQRWLASEWRAGCRSAPHPERALAGPASTAARTSSLSSPAFIKGGCIIRVLRLAGCSGRRGGVGLPLHGVVNLNGAKMRGCLSAAGTAPVSRRPARRSWRPGRCAFSPAGPVSTPDARDATQRKHARQAVWGGRQDWKKVGVESFEWALVDWGGLLAFGWMRERRAGCLQLCERKALTAGARAQAQGWQAKQPDGFSRPHVVRCNCPTACKRQRRVCQSASSVWTDCFSGVVQAHGTSSRTARLSAQEDALRARLPAQLCAQSTHPPWAWLARWGQPSCQTCPSQWAAP